jgi:hypothetical protein
MCRIILVLAILCAPLAARSEVPSILSPDGLPPLRIGMTERAAEKALGVKLNFSADASGDAEVCQEGDVSGKPGIYLLTEHHRIARITVGKDAAEIRTPEGVHIETTEGQLRKIFGQRATFGPRPYEDDVPDAHEVIVKQRGRIEFVFETEHSKVEEMRVGRSEAVQAMEGCA